MDLHGEGLKGGSDVDAGVEGGAEQRQKHVFADGEGRDIGRGDGRKTKRWKAQVGRRLVKERNKEI